MAPDFKREGKTLQSQRRYTGLLPDATHLLRLINPAKVARYTGQMLDSAEKNLIVKTLIKTDCEQTDSFDLSSATEWRQAAVGILDGGRFFY